MLDYLTRQKNIEVDVLEGSRKGLRSLQIGDCNVGNACAPQQLDPGGGGIDPVQSLRNLGHAQVEEGSAGELLGGIRIIGAAEVEDALSGACLKYMLDSPDRCAATPSGGGSPAEA